jgi:hypothetical protein
MAANRGLCEVFQNSRKLEGFETAKRAWLDTSREFWHKHVFKNLPSLEEPLTLETAREVFFWKFRLNASEALKEFAPLIGTAANTGDVLFFKRISAESRKKRNKPMAMLEGTILINWIGCCLWLASDHAGSAYLQQVTGHTTQESAYSKARQRLEKLGLLGYSVAHRKPLIIGCTKQGTFTFRDGWTNLVAGSSR